MKRLYRYIINECLSNFGVVLGAFTGVLLTVRMLQFATLIIDKGVGFAQIGLVFISIIPTFLEIAIPLSTLLGVMLCFARQSGDSELVVMRASGISIFQLIIPVLFFSVFSSIAALSVAHYFKPLGYKSLYDTLFDIARSKTTSGLEEGIFNKLNIVTLYAGDINDTNGDLKHVVLDDRRDPANRRLVISKSGRIFSNKEKRQITILLENGEIHEQQNGKYIRTHFFSNTLNLDPDQLLNNDHKDSGNSVNELYLGDLHRALRYYRELSNSIGDKGKITVADYPQPVPSYISAIPLQRKELKKKMLRLQIESGQRFSLPLASLLLALLALPLGIQPSRAQRTWGVGISACLGMAVFMLYYGLFSFGVVLAQEGKMSVLLALWIPNVSVLLIASYLIWVIGSERWNSFSQMLEVAWEKIRHLLRRKAVTT